MKLLNKLPEPQIGERPTLYADRLGKLYRDLVTAEHKKKLGQYFTSVQVADFMASLCESKSEHITILDPGAGAGILSCAVCEYFSLNKNLSSIKLIVYELDKTLSGLLERTLRYLKTSLQNKNIDFIYEIKNCDFVLQNAEQLDNAPKLFQINSDKIAVDLIISNPPYFKIPKSDSRAKAASTIVHGQPNIYALFMAIAASMLKINGELIFITPRSFASGHYFQSFREYFFSKMQPIYIHSFDSRKEAFNQDDILQENIIVKAKPINTSVNKLTTQVVSISSSVGTKELDKLTARQIPLISIVDIQSKDKVLRIINSDEDEEIINLINSWPGRLRNYGLEISTGPIVPFRATSLLTINGNVPKTHAPLLWLQHVRAMDIKWPVDIRQKAQYVKLVDESRALLVEDKNYVVLRRFSAKEEHRRLTSAPLFAGQLGSHLIGLENHLNYIHRPGGSLSKEEALGLSILYNSSFLDTYFRSINGNTQVSATELRAMPLPDLEIILEIGRKALKLKDPIQHIETLAKIAFNNLTNRDKKIAVYG
jgi:adenine-specific DNA-methyltransferase